MTNEQLEKAKEINKEMNEITFCISKHKDDGMQYLASIIGDKVVLDVNTLILEHLNKALEENRTKFKDL